MIVALGLLAIIAAQDAASLERRVAAAPDGSVRLQFAARPGVLGDGLTTIAWDCDGSGRCRHQHGEWDNGNDWRALLEPGPVRVSLRVRERAVVGVQIYVGGAWRASEHATDLGTVPAAVAARYLIGQARRMGSQSGKAIFAASLADSVTIWPELLKMARDRELRRDTRKQAVFWLGQAAGDAVLASLDSLATAADDDDREVQEAAIFALSQRPDDSGIPSLVRIAREHRDARLRQRAMFWLAQSDDPRAVDLFEEILTRK